MKKLLCAAAVLVALTLPASAKTINEEMFVPIGGIEQWITIKGQDSTNPVVLMVHGGPGDPLSPYADSLFQGWDKDFTLVEWDQRGAGRTYGRTGPSIESTMTMDRMTQDGVEVAQYLIRHLSKPKIILTGGSWGADLGVHMVQARPDLFYALVAQALLVNFQENAAASYAHVLQMARTANDGKTVAALTSIGPPPWKTFLPAWATYHKPMLAYQAKIATAPEILLKISPAYASPAERKQYSEAEDFSQFHFFTGRVPKTKADFTDLPLAGAITQTDLPALGMNFQIPIYIVQGQADLTAPPELAKAYFDRIKAPRKGFTLVPGTGHEPSAASINLTRKILLEQVKPLAK